MYYLSFPYLTNIDIGQEIDIRHFDCPNVKLYQPVHVAVTTEFHYVNYSKILTMANINCSSGRGYSVQLLAPIWETQKHFPKS